MKLYYIVNARIPTEKAHGYQICKMCEEFARLVDEVELIVPNRDNYIKEDTFSFYGVKNNFYIQFLKGLKNVKVKGKFSSRLQTTMFFFSLLLLKIEKGSVVFTRNAEIAWLFKKRGFKVLFEAHDWPERKRSLYKFFICNIDWIICNSQGTGKAHIENGFSNIVVARNGVDISKFDVDVDLKQMKKEFKLSEDKKIVMYIGHLYKWKGVETIFDAAQKMKDNGNIQFVLIGGTKKDILKYKKFVSEGGLTNVTILGYRKKELMPKFLKCADALLLPNAPVSTESLEFTSPIKMFEYMASKRPIIASDLPSIKEVLNEENAVLFEAGNCDDLADKIDGLLRDVERQKRVAGKAFKDVLEFTWDKRAKKIIEKIFA